jgi:hypothetical protein
MSQPRSEEPPDRELYEEAAFLLTALICDSCQATALDPTDLGPGMSYSTPDWDVLLANEALRRGWLIERTPDHYYAVLCPQCRSASPAGR